MLDAMQQPAAIATSPPAPSFSGLLAALTAPGQQPDAYGGGSLPTGRRLPAVWSDDGLEDDVATLSYERALRAHARYRSTEQTLAQSTDAGPVRLDEPPPATSAAAPRVAAVSAASPKPAASFDRIADAEPQANGFRKTPYEQNLKSASITIRVSKAECAQLHRRAAEAGLTVSAYLRSCTFEAESLRAMVRDTLAQLRSSKAQAKPADLAPTRRSWLGGWLARLLTPWHGWQRVARA